VPGHKNKESKIAAALNPWMLLEVVIALVLRVIRRPNKSDSPMRRAAPTPKTAPVIIEVNA
jgi:hypothetical protein